MRIAFGLVSLVTLLALVSPQARAAEAGVTAAVNPDARGTPPGLATRVLDIGTNVLQDEHLKTGDAGQLQVLLRDGTTVTMGPNGDMTVDKFVYDPDKNTAQLALTQTAGLMRIIGGRASKSDEGIVITTPTTTVGIRGGIARTEVNPLTGATFATLIYGKLLTVLVDGRLSSVTHPGLTLAVLGKGQQPGPAQKATTDQVLRANALLEGVPGRTGGAIQPVSDNVGAIRSANANGPSAATSFATVLSNPAFAALTNLQVGSTVTQALIQSVLDNVAALANLPACSSCYNVAIGGGVPVTSAAILYTAAGGVTDFSGNPYTGQGLYLDNPYGGPPITTLVPYVPQLGGATAGVQAGIVNDLSIGSTGVGIINPVGLVNTGSISVANYLAGNLGDGSRVSQYGAGAITAVTLNGAGVPTQIRNVFIDSVIDTSFMPGFGSFPPETETNGFAVVADTTMTLHGAALAQRVGDNVMQAIRTTGGSGTVTQNATFVYELTNTNTNTGAVLFDHTQIDKWNLSAAFALSPSQSLHFVLGQPPTNIPNIGIFTYNLIGATSPTFSDGSGIGVFSAGTLTMNWANSYSFGTNRNVPVFNVNARVLMPGDALYTLAISGGLLGQFGGSTTSSVSVSGTVGVTGSSRVCPGSCVLLGTGAIGGPGANHLGFTYSIGDPSTFPSYGTIGNAGNRIFGAAVFAR